MIEFLTFWVVLPLLSTGLLLGLIRMVLGPTLPDRIVAFDMIAIQMVGVLAVLSVAKNQPTLLDVAAVWAVISFLSIIALAFYIEKTRKKQ